MRLTGPRARERYGQHRVPDPVGAGLPQAREARAPRHQALEPADQLARGVQADGLWARSTVCVCVCVFMPCCRVGKPELLLFVFV